MFDQEIEAMPDVHKMHGIQGMQGMQGGLGGTLATRSKHRKSLSGPTKPPIEKKRQGSDTSSRGPKKSSGPAAGDKKLVKKTETSVESLIGAVENIKKIPEKRGRKKIPANNALGFLKDVSTDDSSDEMPAYSNGKLVGPSKFQG